MHSVTFGLELRIPRRLTDRHTHTHTQSNAPDALTQVFCERHHVLRDPGVSEGPVTVYDQACESSY